MSESKRASAASVIVPLSWEACVDYRLNAMSLSGPEIESIALSLGNDGIDEILSKREADELEAKLKRLDNWDCNGNQFVAKKCFKSGREAE